MPFELLRWWWQVGWRRRELQIRQRRRHRPFRTVVAAHGATPERRERHHRTVRGGPVALQFGKTSGCRVGHRNSTRRVATNHLRLLLLLLKRLTSLHCGTLRSKKTIRNDVRRCHRWWRIRRSSCLTTLWSRTSIALPQRLQVCTNAGTLRQRPVPVDGLLHVLYLQGTDDGRLGSSSRCGRNRRNSRRRWPTGSSGRPLWKALAAACFQPPIAHDRDPLEGTLLGGRFLEGATRLLTVGVRVRGDFRLLVFRVGRSVDQVGEIAGETFVREESVVVKK